MSNPVSCSVSTGAQEDGMDRHAWLAKRALSDCVMLDAAALENGVAGMTGKGASAAKDRLLTMAPLERRNQRKNARVTLNIPRKLTAKCCSMASELIRSS